MTKAFCINCKHRINGVQGLYNKAWICKKTMWIENKPNRRIKFYKKCSEVNKNNDCVNFKSVSIIKSKWRNLWES